MGDELAFVDTNVFIYAFDHDEPAKQARAVELLTRWPTGRLVTSAQVLSEFFEAVTRKRTPRLSHRQAQDEVRKIAPLARAAIDAELVKSAISLRVARSISYWDALIVAAAARLHCDVVLTEDLNAGEVIAGVRIVNPF